MILLGPDDEITLDAIAQGCVLWFKAGSETYYLRPPTTEQYDEATGVERVATVLFRSREDVSRLAEFPPSLDDVVLRTRELKRYEELFAEAADGSTKKELAADMIAALQVLLSNRTRADQEAETRAMLKRDRYLVMVCLCDVNGKRTFANGSADSVDQWEGFSLGVKDAARSHIWRILRAMKMLPFVLAKADAPESD